MYYGANIHVQTLVYMGKNDMIVESDSMDKIEKVVGSYMYLLFYFNS